MVPHRTGTGTFRNPWPGATPHGFRGFWKWVLVDRPRTPRPPDPGPEAFPRATPSFPTPHAPPGALALTWIGHTSFLVQLGGKNLLLDPIWSTRASPLRFVGPRRRVPPAVAFDTLPPIDVVVLSHDHYDHLDRATVDRLVRDHPGVVWVAPLGVGAWLRRRGATVAAELDWWDSAVVDGVALTCTPAQHFSGRALHTRDATLWCGWTMRETGDGTRSIFFAGDTGYHPEFGAIAERLGPFDAALLPIGAYEPRWFMRPVHAAPEEAVAAYVDIARANGGRPCTFVAMHWGTFKLTDEPMDEPPHRARAAWLETPFDPTYLWIPSHGETRQWDGE